MTASDWARNGSLALAIYLDGSDDPDRAADGTLLVDDDFLVLVNAWWEPLDFTVPPTRLGLTMQTFVDTYESGQGRGRATGRQSAESWSPVDLRPPRPAAGPHRVIHLSRRRGRDLGSDQWRERSTRLLPTLSLPFLTRDAATIVIGRPIPRQCEPESASASSVRARPAN
jgi:hypothetical protein